MVDELGVIVAAGAAGAAFLLRSPAARAVAVLVALTLTPVLLVADLWDSDQLQAVHDRPAVALAAALAGLGCALGLAALLRRRPSLFPLLCVGALPFRVPVEAGGETANLLVPLYLVVAAGCLAYAWDRLRPAETEPAIAPRERDAGALELALLFAVVVYAVQAAYSGDFQKALESAVFFYVPFALLFKLLAGADWTRRVLERCFAVAVGLALLFVAIGFWEYAARDLLLNPKVLEANQFKSYFRVNSLFFDPNIYGRFLALVMVTLAGGLLWAREQHDAVRAAVILAVLWAGLLLTFSQSSFAALLVGLGVLGLLRWRARVRHVVAAGVALVVLAVALAASGALAFSLSSENSINRATSGRLKLLDGGLEMFFERPLGGFGSGSFHKEFTEREDVSTERADAASHTIPVTIAAEQGLVGLLAYALVLITAFSVLFGGLAALRERGPPRPELVVRAIVAAAFCALFFHTLAYAAFLEDPVTWLLLGLGLGLKAAEPTLTAAERAARRARAAREGTTSTAG